MQIVIIIVKIVEAILLPPGLFIILFLLGAVWLRKKSRVSSILFVASAAFVYVLSTVVGVMIFVRPLEKQFTRSEDFKPDAVVVFGGGVVVTPYGYQLCPNTVFRLMTGVELALKYEVPLVLSGGYLPGTGKEPEAVVMKEFASRYMQKDKIIIEPAAVNTKQNAEYTMQIAKKYNFERFYLVSSAVHLKRSVSSFGETDLEISPYPSNYLYDYSVSWIDFLPNKDALNANLSAFHEFVGILYYRLLDFLAR